MVGGSLRHSSGIIRLAVVGGGPGGFFTAQHLIKVSDNNYRRLYVSMIIVHASLYYDNYNCSKK